MKKEVKGLFTLLEGQSVYKIENYDQMENFFMTITSSTDVWNFCWSQGGVTAGRINSNHAIFPYYTADKVADAAPYTGNYTCIKVKTADGYEFWEPFASLHDSPSVRVKLEKNITRNIYKNFNGSQVWFEEINEELNLLYRTSWASSEKYGIVRSSYIVNLCSKSKEIEVLDGCQNILPACVTSDFQNNNSVLLDAYKKTDLDEKANLALFTVSSIVSDKAEPNEGLYANTCWFSCPEKIILDIDAPVKFANQKDLEFPVVSKGKRSSAFVCRKIKLAEGESQQWFQVFDTSLTFSRIEVLRNELKDRNGLTEKVCADVAKCDEILTGYLAAADGIQKTDNEMACLHHRENVMFNVMRGGIFADNGRINGADFVKFIGQRNKALVAEAQKTVDSLGKDLLEYQDLSDAVEATGSAQLKRLFLEYMPITFSRRHGDPSRPWNVFNIKLKDAQENPILNYEGNWRDIFQNWEALAYSYPTYIKNMCAKFLNAMTIDGFNPYKINREGVDWEIPDPTNPWAQIGYWGDHQVIYFEKLLEFYDKTNHDLLVSSLNEKIYTSSNVPYRLKSYEEILENPRSTIVFDKELSQALKAASAEKGSDAKLVQDKDGNPYLVSFTAKAVQIVIGKISNLIPGGGIWLNTQRPEWNDANNALAGYGLSVVTTCYLYRYLNFLTGLYQKAGDAVLTMPVAMKECLEGLYDLYSSTNAAAACQNNAQRKAFADKAGKLFQKERDAFYANGYNDGEAEISASQLAQMLKKFNEMVEQTVRVNKRKDNLYHSYNTLKLVDDGMEVQYLQEMLEGQVAVLSAGLLSSEEVMDLLNALEESKMYESRQKSYMLYPNKELPAFLEKNCVSEKDVASLGNLVERTGCTYLEKDVNGAWHFNPEFRNANVFKDFIASMKGTACELSADECKNILDLYEKTFNHQSFTGRSGTFYAYEGLGSIYWHMVSKLLLAVQENIFVEYKKENAKMSQKLSNAYYKIRGGLSYNKTPELYGAFPQDPYSHTPYLQGAKQPGMTGQVKEEILTRWGELGITIEEGTASFVPFLLQDSEYAAENKICFTWCGIPVTYVFTKDKECYITVSGMKRKGNSLTRNESKDVFLRNGNVKEIVVEFANCY